MSTPVVSVGLPVYNGARYLEAAIRSIVEQDFDAWELVISDNASTDATRDICLAFAARDSRIRYSRLEANCGAAGNYRRVFQLSRGTYFKWQAHDDACLPGFLRRCVETISAAPPSVVLVYPRSEIIDEHGRTVGVDEESLCSGHDRAFRRAVHVIRHVNLAWAQFGIARAAALRATRLIDPFIGSDYVLLAELAMLGHLVEIPDVLFQRRVHPGASNIVHKRRTEWLAFLDTSKKGRGAALPPSVRIGIECARSAGRLRLGLAERLACGIAVPAAWYYRKIYQWGSGCKDRLKEVVGYEVAEPPRA